MSLDEVNEFLDESKIAVLTTLGLDGWPHAAGMWYVRKGETLCMWTYAKSQKALNLKRDDRCAAVVESGERYEDLKGVLIQARAELVNDFDEVAGIGRDLYERYTQPLTGIPYDSGASQEIERQAHKRIGILLSLETLASWDHSKLT